MESILKNLKTLPNSEAIITDYQNDIKLCKKAGEKETDCIKLVDLKYTRKFPVLKDLVYPWVNYDWDYTTFVDNNYNKGKTGATDSPSLGGLFDDMDAMVKLGKGYITDANPSKGSLAGITDSPVCDSSKDNYAGCQIMNQIKRSTRDQAPPFTDVFFNKSLSGENSSSYFIRAGTCPKPDLNQQQCNAKGYTWVENPLYAVTPAALRPSDFIPGSCFKPRYAYIKNTPGIELDFSGIEDINSTLGSLATKASGMAGTAATAGIGAAGSATGQSGSASLAQTGVGASSSVASGSIGAGVAASNATLAASQGPINSLLSLFKGAVPSIMGDAISLNPLALKKVMEGKTTSDFVAMTCEGFTNCKKIGEAKDSTKWWNTTMFLILTITATLVMLSFLKYGKTQQLIDPNNLTSVIITLCVIVFLTICFLIFTGYKPNI